MPQRAPLLLTLTRTLLTLAHFVTAIGTLVSVVFLIVAIVNPDGSRFASALAGLDSQARAHIAWIGAAGAVLSGIALLAMLGQLRSLVDTAIAGDPFVAENGRRLRRIGWFVLAFEVVTHAMATTIAFQLKPDFRAAPLSLPFAGAVVVLMIFVLAHIFEHGTRLRIEVQGTV